MIHTKYYLDYHITEASFLLWIDGFCLFQKQIHFADQDSWLSNPECLNIHHSDTNYTVQNAKSKYYIGAGIKPIKQTKVKWVRYPKTMQKSFLGKFVRLYKEVAIKNIGPRGLHALLRN